MTPPNPTNSATAGNAIPLTAPVLSSGTESSQPAAETPAAGPQASPQPTAQASAAGPQASAQPAAQAPADDQKGKEEAPNSKRVWEIGIGGGPREEGGRNGGPVFIDNISTYGDYYNFNIYGALKYKLAGKNNLLLQGGPYIAWDHFAGGENVGGSNGDIGTVGVRGGLWWGNIYGNHTLTGPSGIDIYLGGGGGRAHATVDGGFQLHDFSGFALKWGVAADLVGVTLGSARLGLNGFLQQDALYGSEANKAGRTLGLSLVARSSTEQQVEKCDGSKRSIDAYIDSVANLRAENTKIKADLEQLKSFLESGSDPLTTANIRDALFYREVRMRLLVNKKLDEKAVRTALHNAYIAKKEGKAEKDINASIVREVPNLSSESLATAEQDASKMYPEGYDFWAQITPDPGSTNLPRNIKDLECKEIDEWVERMHKEEQQLIRRNSDLKGRFDTAVLVDALKDLMGKDVEVEKVVEKIETVDRIIRQTNGFTLDIIQPNFLFDHPTLPEVTNLQAYVKKAGDGNKVLETNDTKLLNIARTSHALIPFEVKNMEDIAAILKGEKCPSATDGAGDSCEWMGDESYVIEGHTDGQGTAEYNKALSQRRADWIKDMLVGFGVDETHLEAIGYGKEHLAAPEEGNAQQKETARNKNRRVVIRIKPHGRTPAPSAPFNTTPDEPPPPRARDAKKPKAPDKPTPPPARGAPQPPAAGGAPQPPAAGGAPQPPAAGGAPQPPAAGGAPQPPAAGGAPQPPAPAAPPATGGRFNTGSGNTPPPPPASPAGKQGSIRNPPAPADKKQVATVHNF